LTDQIQPSVHAFFGFTRRNTRSNVHSSGIPFGNSRNVLNQLSRASPDFPHLISSGFQRITGCRKAMEDHGIPLEDSFIFSEGLSYDIGYRGAEILLARHPDMTALGLMAALSDRGIRVPADVSVMGFDDIGVGERCRPRMTCVHQPIPGIVEKSVELLIHGIEDPGGQTPSSIIMPHSITIRGSCRRI
jgi:LacI family transcriptional regulator